jgi:hypothetical protein
VPNVARQKGWKRPRTLDKGGEEDGDKERPRKVQVTTNLLSMMLKEPMSFIRVTLHQNP